MRSVMKRLTEEDRFSRMFACWANNHKGWSKTKKRKTPRTKVRGVFLVLFQCLALVQELAAVDDVQHTDGHAEDQCQDAERQRLSAGAGQALAGFFHCISFLVERHALCRACLLVIGFSRRESITFSRS